MSVQSPRIAALERLVAQYERSLAGFSNINEELRTLPVSQRLTEIIELNEVTIQTTLRLLETARMRLERERSSGMTAAPFDFEGAAETHEAPASPA